MARIRFVSPALSSLPVALLPLMTLACSCPSSQPASPKRGSVCSPQKSPRGGEPHSGLLTGLALKFPLVSKAFSAIKQAFGKRLIAGSTDTILLSNAGAVLADLGAGKLTEQQLKDIFEVPNMGDAKATISFRNFLTQSTLNCFLKMDNPSPDFQTVKHGVKVIDEAFKKIDQDNNGELEAGELRTALFEMGGADKEILETRFKELDVDKSGHIRFKSFIYGFGNWVYTPDDDDSRCLLQFRNCSQMA